MSEARWFLAHTKQDNDSDIDSWCQHLTDLLATEGWTTIVTPGRDDYSARARAMGGWNQWQTDVPQAETFMGEPMFHGIIVPADALDDAPTTGRATAKMIAGFLARGKHVLSWCATYDEFRHVVAIDEVPDAPWQAWATLIFPEEETTKLLCLDATV
tara:strand:+ start:327 stop:797 length:471 start_codon:yes stop_codon:yes gene_type:complete